MYPSKSIRRNQRSPRRQSMSRSLIRNEAVIMRRRLHNRPVEANSRIAASDDQIAGVAAAPRFEGGVRTVGCDPMVQEDLIPTRSRG